MSPRSLPPLVRRFMPWAILTGARLLRPLTVGVRAVIFDRQGRVLLLRHTYVSGWHLPGGGVEAGETARAAVIREAREEAHVAVRGEPVLHGVFLQRRHDHVLVYLIRDFEIVSGEKADWEIAETGFFALDELPEETTAPTRRRLREVIDGVTKAETW